MAEHSRKRPEKGSTVMMVFSYGGGGGGGAIRLTQCIC